MGSIRRKRIRARAFFALVVLLLNASAAETVADNPSPPLLAWKEGRLEVLQETALPAMHIIAELINRERFGEALARIEGMERPDVGDLQAELAMACAGHPAWGHPATALEAAGRHIENALQDAPENPRLVRLAHELELFRVSQYLDDSSFARIRHARDEALRGRLPRALEHLTPVSSDARQATLERWALCAAFEGRPDGEALRKDLEQTLRDALRAEPEDGLLLRLSALLEQTADPPWASLALPAESLLYPQWEMRRVRALHWSLKEAGTYRASARQALNEALVELKRFFPNHPLIRSYAGEGVPWGGELGLSPAPPDAPAWAIAMRELRARVDYVAEWWFRNRQQPDGSFTGDWAGDCSVLPSWLIPTACCGNSAVESGAGRLMDGAWAHRAELAEGGDRGQEHDGVGRVQIVSAVMPGVFYGEPQHVERLLAYTRLLREEYTAVNEQGHRHFKQLPPGLAENTNANLDLNGLDFPLYGEAMQPAAVLAWYSGLPDAVSLLHEWTLAWSEDAARLGLDKPGGVFPACVRFSDEDVDGSGHWWEPGMGEPFTWDPASHLHVLGNALAAWRLTRDENVLRGIQEGFHLVRRYLGVEAGTIGEHGPGSAYWAARRITEALTPLLGTYRAVTGDTQFDDLEWALLPSYARFLVCGDPASVHNALASDLATLRRDLPLLTSEAPGPEHVALPAESLLGSLTGSPAPLTNAPSWAVTWREVGRDFTALVRTYDERSLSAWVYSFADQDIRPRARFWRLEPGRYEVRLGQDANADGATDAPASEIVSLDYTERSDSAQFTLPPRTLSLLEVVQIGPAANEGLSEGERLRVHRPDIAVGPDDVVTIAEPRVGQPCRVNVVVHNIGSADAEEVTVEMTASPAKEERAGLTVGKVRYGTLGHPGDFEAKRGLATFEWRPDAVQKYRLEISASCSNPEGEIWSGNNRRVLEIDVME